MAWFDPGHGQQVVREMMARDRVDEAARRADELGPLREAAGKRKKRGFIGTRLLRHIRGGGD